MQGHANSGVTASHIAAADKLREAVDVATLGYSAVRPLIFVSQAIAGSRYGLGAAEKARMAALRRVQRVIALFPAPALRMIEAIVLGNMSLRAWTLALPQPAAQAVQKGRLLGILDQLVQHFDGEIRDEVASGRRLPP